MYVSAIHVPVFIHHLVICTETLQHDQKVTKGRLAKIKDEKLHTAGLDDTAIILLIEIKVTEMLLKKCLILQYRKPQFFPQYSEIMTVFFPDQD